MGWKRGGPACRAFPGGIINTVNVSVIYVGAYGFLDSGTLLSLPKIMGSII